MVTKSTQWWEIGLFTTVDEDVVQPDQMMHYGSVPFDMNTLRHGYPTTDNGFCLTPNVTQGRSRGTVRLRSRDFRDRARVDPRYFTDPEGYDERIMLTGVKLARTIAEQPPLAAWVGRELAPGPEATSDDELLDYIHRCHNTVYHPAATARMGAATDPMAVLDPQLRVNQCGRLPDRRRRAGRDLRLHAAADRCGNGFRGAHHHAEHIDPAAGCPGPGPVRQTCRVGVPGVHGLESRLDGSAHHRSRDRRKTRRRTRPRRGADGRTVRPGPRRRREDDRTPRVLCADPVDRRWARHLHRS